MASTDSSTPATTRPWFSATGVSPENGFGFCLLSEDGRSFLEGNGVCANDVENEANVRLIVTAVNCHDDLLEVVQAYADRDRFDTVNSAHRIEIVAKWLPRIEELFPVSGTHSAHASWTQAAFRELPGRLAQAAIAKARGGAGK